MRSSRGLWIASVVAALLLIGAAQPAGADHMTPRLHDDGRPLREGLILGGPFTVGPWFLYTGASPSAPCQQLPDCATWVTSGCQPQLAGRNPAWLASIVKVRDLADGRTARYLWASADGAGGALVQYWTRQCGEIESSRARGGVVWGWPWSGIWTGLNANWVMPLVIPSDAMWMTIAAGANSNVKWRVD